MFLSQLVGKEIFVNGAFKGVCLGIGVSKKNCSVKYLLCSLSTTDTSHIDFAVNFTAITEIFTNGIHLSSLRPVIPKHCWKVFQNRPIYTLDGVKVGEITDSVIENGALQNLLADKKRIDCKRIIAFADAIIIKKSQPYPLGVNLPKSDLVVTKPILKNAIKSGELIKFTLSLAPFDKTAD